VLAAFCGVSEQMVFRWESGDAVPSNLFRLAVGLGVPLDALRAGDEAWDRYMQSIQPVSAPDIFLPPTQWPAELSAERAEPYREKEAAVGPAHAPAPVAAPARQRRLAHSVEQHFRQRGVLPTRCGFCGAQCGGFDFVCDECDDASA